MMMAADDSDEDDVLLFSRQRWESFGMAKEHALGKVDKSSAGRIDPRAVSVCAAINASAHWFTTSSCAGRCFLWRGVGVKATSEFSRGRVSHEKIDEAYFLRESEEEEQSSSSFSTAPLTEKDDSGGALWLRFEPFILHVRCRSRLAAMGLCRAAREAGFKNVGLVVSSDFPFVSVVGDEGLEMPLRTRDRCLFRASEAQWLVDIVNEKHERNWSRINKFEEAILKEAEKIRDNLPTSEKKKSMKYDIVGDVALLSGNYSQATYDELFGELSRKKKVRVLAIEQRSEEKDDSSALTSSSWDRARRCPFVVVAGQKRDPLLTTHRENGLRIVVDLNRVFFSPKLALERLRLCRCVRRSERVLSLFCGCGPEALSIAARTEATEVVAVDANDVGLGCLSRSLDTLRRINPEAAKKVILHQGDALAYLLENDKKFDRVIAPRPKHPNFDGDNVGDSQQPLDASFGGPGGIDFLDALLPRLTDQGEVHWTDFAADWELPTCQRTRDFVHAACQRANLDCEVTYVGKAGPSVAKRQFRVTIDFRLQTKRPEE